MTTHERIAAICAAYEAQRKYAARTKAKGGKAAKLAQLRQDVRNAWEEHGPHLLPIMEEIVWEAERRRAIEAALAQNIEARLERSARLQDALREKVGGKNG